MKKGSLVLVLLILISMCSGCAGTDELLVGSQEEFSSELEAYELAHEGEIPKSVLDTLDFMLENYTGGVSNDYEEYNLDDMDDEDSREHEEKLDEKLEKYQEQGTQVIDNIIDSEQEFIDFMVDKLENKEENIVCKINSSLFSEKFMTDMLFIDISGNHIIEAMHYNYFNYCYRNAGNYIDVDLTICYNFSKSELTRMREATEKKADEIVEQLALNDPAKTDYDKVKLVNDYLCRTASYSSGNPPYQPIQHTAYGALINGDCVCEGYTKAANLIFSKCGVESYYVLGAVENPNDHCWNIVNINGNYYQLDITWNDAEGCPNQYFLVTDDYMSLSRTWDVGKYPKTANKPYSN